MPGAGRRGTGWPPTSPSAAAPAGAGGPGPDRPKRSVPGAPAARDAGHRRGRTSRRARPGRPSRDPTSRPRGEYDRRPCGEGRRTAVDASRSGLRTLPALRRPGFAAQRAVLAIPEGVVGLDERMELARALVDHGRLRVAQVAFD